MVAAVGRLRTAALETVIGWLGYMKRAPRHQKRLVVGQDGRKTYQLLHRDAR